MQGVRRARPSATGIDVFRIFDALNDIDGMTRRDRRGARDAGAGRGGALLHRAICSDPAERVYTLDYYLRLAEALVEAGVHVLAIKDMAGLLRAPAARTLSTALRERFDAPVHLHTHDTAGGSLATYLAAVRGRRRRVDGAAAPLAGMTSQPSLSAIVAALAGSRARPAVTLDCARSRSSPTGRRCAPLYAPFEAGLRRADRPRVPPRDPRRPALEPAPAGRRDRRRRALRGDRGRLRARQRAAREHHQGHPDQQGRRRPRDLSPSPPASTSTSSKRDPAALRPARLACSTSCAAGSANPPGGLPAAVHRAGAQGPAVPAAAPPALDAGRRSPRSRPPGRERQDTPRSDHVPRPARGLPRPPGPATAMSSLLPTPAFFYGLREDEALPVDLAPGVRVIFELEAIGEPDENGIRTVMARVNGQLRPIDVRDRRSSHRLRADRARRPGAIPGHIAAPVIGAVIIDGRGRPTGRTPAIPSRSSRR